MFLSIPYAKYATYLLLLLHYQNFRSTWPDTIYFVQYYCLPVFLEQGWEKTGAE